MQTNPLNFCCLIRDIDLTDPGEYTAFKWYWEVALRKVGGVAGWDKRIRHFTTISKAPFPQDPSLQQIDISTEAYVVLLWDNCFFKWNETLVWKKKHPNRKLTARRVNTKHMTIFKAQYTSQDGGQKKLGGWGPEGINRFNAIYDAISAAKFEGYGTDDQSETPKESWTKLEKDFLARLRIDMNIEAHDA